MKKSIFKRIGLIALAVCVAIGSFFVPVTKKQYNFASADTSYNSIAYSGSSVWMPIERVVSNSLYYDYLTFGVDFIFDVYNKSFTFDTSRVGGFVSYDSYNFQGTSYNYHYITSVTNGSNTQFVHSNLDISTNYYFVDYFYYFANNQRYQSYVIVSFDSFFDSSVFSISLGNVFLSHISNFEGYYNYICYTDANDHSLYFYFKINPSNDKVLLNSRVYYTSVGSDLTSNQAFNQGYNQGLADNQQNVYDNGYNAGYGIGYGNGVTAGRADANDFSFISLIGAVIDVPLQTFLGLFHFELLGINLSNFILALLTVAFIIFIIKLILGSK